MKRAACAAVHSSRRLGDTKSPTIPNPSLALATASSWRRKPVVAAQYVMLVNPQVFNLQIHHQVCVIPKQLRILVSGVEVLPFGWVPRRPEETVLQEILENPIRGPGLAANSFQGKRTNDSLCSIVGKVNGTPQISKRIKEVTCKRARQSHGEFFCEPIVKDASVLRNVVESLNKLESVRLRKLLILVTNCANETPDRFSIGSVRSVTKIYVLFVPQEARN